MCVRVHVGEQACECLYGVDLQSLPRVSVLHHSQIKEKVLKRQGRGNERDGWRDRRDIGPFRGSHLRA